MGLVEFAKWTQLKFTCPWKNMCTSWQHNNITSPYLTKLVFPKPVGSTHPSPVVDSTKLFFFANKEFFRFLLVSLRFCYIQQKIIDSKMT